MALIVVLASGAPAARAQAPLQSMVQVRLAGQVVEGQPLAWSQNTVQLLARDGQLVTFRPSAAKDLRQIAPRFVGLTPSEMRGTLFNEFGRDFEIEPTQHFVVVYPRGSKAPWATRFEDLYKQFYQYFRVRGFSLRDAQVPLVAIVFPSRKDYQAYSVQHGMPISANYWGHYSSLTNRVYLFDVEAEYPQLGWQEAAALIVHEATHQTAFNSGIHSRFAPMPRWVSEGLAMMFEARGVWNSSRYTSQSDRLNRERLTTFRENLAQRPTAWFGELIRSDTPFKTKEGDAYAEAWAFSFYLCETQPRLYAKYLAKTAARDPFTDYSPDERLNDFTAIFGSNMALIDAQFLRYMAKLR